MGLLAQSLAVPAYVCCSCEVTCPNRKRSKLPRSPIYYHAVIYRAAALTSQNHMTNYFRKAKEHSVQWQLNRSYCLTCTPGHIAAQFNWHGNGATVTVDTVVLGKCQAACVSKITVELTTFLPCSLMSEME